MKEIEKAEIKRLSDRLDALRPQQAAVSLTEAADKYRGAGAGDRHAGSGNRAPERRAYRQAQQRSAEADGDAV